MQICRRDDEVGIHAASIGKRDSGRLRASACGGRRDDRGDLGTRFDGHACPSRDSLDGTDDLIEPSLRVEHAVREVEVAHEVIKARHSVRRPAEEHCGIPEDLLEALIAEAAFDVTRKRRGQERSELRHAAQH